MARALLETPGSFEPGALITCLGCRSSNNACSVHLFANQHAFIGASSVLIQTIGLICGCGRHKEVNVDAYPGTEVVPLMTRFFPVRGVQALRT